MTTSIELNNILASSGNFTSSLQINGTGVSISGHTQLASSISDSTTAGRALLTGADASAQRTSLGLGTLATQNGTFSGTSSGTNTGDQTISIGGDVTAAGSTGALTATVTKINGVSLSGLSTGLLKNTTGTGQPSIAIAGTDYAAVSHTHTASNITDFNSSVSGLLPITSILAGSNINISSTGSVYSISSSGGGTQTIYEYVAPSAFPASGSSSTLYIATDSNRIYRWNNPVYVEMGPIGGGDVSLWNLLLPGAPTNVTGVASSGQVALSWTEPSFVGVPLTDYIIQYSSNSGTSWTTFTDGISTTASATVTGLNNGTNYIFKVAAVNTIGTGVYSSNSSSYVPGGDPYISNVSLLLLMDGSNNSTTFTDSGPVGHTVTAVGDAKISTTTSKFGSSSLYIDGNGDYLSIPSHASLSLGTGNFTIEFWAYCTDQTTPYPGYLSSQGGWNAGAWGIRFDNNGASQKWGFWKNPADPVMTSSSTYSFDTWRHVAFVRQAGTWRIYVDGVQACSSTTQGTDSFDLAYGGTLRIGWGTWDGGNGYAKDYIDCLRITKDICRYPDGTTFTPSSTAFVNY